jgi:hypothetical protein
MLKASVINSTRQNQFLLKEMGIKCHFFGEFINADNNEGEIDV